MHAVYRDEASATLTVEFRGRFDHVDAAEEEAARARQGYAPQASINQKQAKPTTDEAHAQLLPPPERLRRAGLGYLDAFTESKAPEGTIAQQIHQHNAAYTAAEIADKGETTDADGSPKVHLGTLNEGDYEVLRELAARATGDYLGVVFLEERGSWVAHCGSRREGPYSTPHDAAWAYDCMAYEGGLIDVRQTQFGANFPQLLQRKIDSGTPCSTGDRPSAMAALPPADDD